MVRYYSTHYCVVHFIIDIYADKSIFLKVVDTIEKVITYYDPLTAGKASIDVMLKLLWVTICDLFLYTCIYIYLFICTCLIPY